MTKDNLKIVFFGTPDFAVESLRCIHEAGYNVVAVVTAPDKPAGRGKHLSQPAVKEYALIVGIPVMQPVKLKDPDFISQLQSYGAQLFVVIASRSRMDHAAARHFQSTRIAAPQIPWRSSHQLGCDKR